MDEKTYKSDLLVGKFLICLILVAIAYVLSPSIWVFLTSWLVIPPVVFIGLGRK